MAGQAIDFLCGAAAIISPAQGVPLLLGTSALKAARTFQRNRRQRLPANGPGNGQGEPGAQHVRLTWQHVTCSLMGKKGDTRQILQSLSGEAKPGRLLAIMGPSGSGKTTLLNALSGQVPRQERMHLSGRVLVNGQAAEQAGHRQGYVQQEDIFYSQLTVRETLMMAAHLRMPGAASAERKEQLVESLIQRLGLSKAADTIVGDKKNRGLSGGEKKRLSIGAELIAGPMLLFTDEPTTGLDSFQAEKVMQTLKDLCSDNHTVVCSIHQPRSSIFAMFDDLVLLSDGQLLYSGPAKEAIAYFAGLGYKCPEHYNPAEYLADLISVDASSPDLQEKTRAKTKELADAWRSRHQGSAGAVPAAASRAGAGQRPEPAGPTCSFQRQLRLLFKRSWRQVSRDRATIAARCIANVSAALIFGSIFNRMKLTRLAIQDRMGLLQVAAINTAMGSLVKTCTAFPSERTIVTRERSKGSYGVLPYLGSKLVAELPVGALFPVLFACITYPATGLHAGADRFAKFLGITVLESFAASSMGLSVGSIAPTGDAAQAIGPAIMTVFIVFGGYYANADNVPRPLRWLPHTSLIKHAFEAFCVNEFRGLTFRSETPAGKPLPGSPESGEQVLERLSFADSSLRRPAMGLARVMLFNYWLTYFVLQSKRPTFQQMQDPAEEAAAEPVAGNNGNGASTGQA